MRTTSVEILRDTWGIAHVYGETEEALFYGAGYAMAEDRLFQLMVVRRLAQGRIAEILGAGPAEGGSNPKRKDQYLKSDIRARTMGFRQHAEKQLPRLDPDIRANLEAFAQGINANIAERRGRLSPLFDKHGGKPEPWTAVDTLAIWNRRALSFIESWEAEHRTLREMEAKGEDVGRPETEQPWRPIEEEAAIVAEEEFERTAPEAYKTLKAMSLKLGRDKLPPHPRYEGFKASHNWAVTRSRSVSGSALMEGKPQLEVRCPNVMYEIHLVGGGYNFRGSAVPGTPGMIMGFGERLGWSCTALGGDNADLFQEKVNPENPNEYLFKGNWEKFESREETIRVKGGDPVALSILSSRHGPVVNHLLQDVRPGEAFALAVSIFHSDVVSLQGALKMMRSGDWAEFRGAMREYAAPPLHITYVDARGNIGYQSLTAAPKRLGARLRPRQGWTGEEEWEMLPFEWLPCAFNPKNDFMMSANHLAAGGWHPFVVGTGRGDGPRSQRIREMVLRDRKFSRDDFLNGPNVDSVNCLLRDVVLLGRKIAEEDGAPSEDAAKALEALKDWNFNLTTEAPGYHVASCVLDELKANMAGATWIMGYGGDWQTLIASFKKFMPVFHESGKTPPDPEFRRWLMSYLEKGYRRSLQRPAPPREGELYRMPYQDSMDGLGSFAPELDQTASLRCTVMQTVWSQTGETYNQIVDYGDLDKSLALMPPGISEDPASPHFRDQVEIWQAGKMRPAPISRAAVEAIRESSKMLQYAG